MFILDSSLSHSLLLLQDYEPTPCQLTVILTVYILGIWLHHTADVQKYFVLRARKGLITDGLFSMSRNPNYLGEMFIYAAFAGKYHQHHQSTFYQSPLLSAFAWNHPVWWWSWSQLLVVWTVLFYPSWLAKDRYKEWSRSRYTSHTGTGVS